jgi:Kef-type K+ transport system membrane component KefB
MTVVFLALAALLAASRLLGDLARRFRQPAVLGELIAGILLGPTALGAIRPEWVEVLFPASGPEAESLHAITKLAIALFLVVAGTEVDLSLLRQYGRAAVAVSLAGVLLPFAAGFAAATGLPGLFFSGSLRAGPAFPLFLGTALSIREKLGKFVEVILAPLFFASVGTTTNFAAHFDLALVLIVLVIASVSKILGCYFGARVGGLGRRESWCIGFGMNARGAMEIILALAALQAGVIDERNFVALVVMAMATSMMGGYFLRRLIAPSALHLQRRGGLT